jgi:hypothetical protein
MMYTRNTFIMLLMILIAAIFTGVVQAQDTWESTNGPTRGEANVLDMAVGRASSDANATLYDMEGTFIKYSLNAGSTWSTASSLGGDPLVITCKPTTPTRIIGGYNFYIKYSNNNGINWTQSNITNDQHVVPITAATSKPSSSENLMFVGIQKYSTFSSMKRSENGGLTWYDVNSFFGNIQTDVTALAPHPTNAQIAFAGGTIPPPRTLLTGEQSELLVEPPATYTNGVFFSTDAGITWYNSGNVAKNVKALATYTSSGTTYGFAGTDDSNAKLKKSTNATNTGASWITVVSYPGGLIRDIRVDQNNVIFVSAADGIYKSTNNGTNWINLSGNGFIDPGNMKRLGIDPQNANIKFAGSTTNLYKSTDNGSTWRDAAPSSSNLSISAVAANDSHYTERFMDLPSENPEGYKNASVMTYADKYKGMLRIVHGAMDDNVHMQNSIQLIDKLEDLGKHFEFMLYPGERHGWGGPKATHLRNETYRFYYKYLLEKEFPEKLFQ